MSTIPLPRADSVRRPVSGSRPSRPVRALSSRSRITSESRPWRLVSVVIALASSASSTSSRLPARPAVSVSKLSVASRSRRRVSAASGARLVIWLRSRSRYSRPTRPASGSMSVIALPSSSSANRPVRPRRGPRSSIWLLVRTSDSRPVSAASGARSRTSPRAMSRWRRPTELTHDAEVGDAGPREHELLEAGQIRDRVDVGERDCSTARALGGAAGSPVDRGW